MNIRRMTLRAKSGKLLLEEEEVDPDDPEIRKEMAKQVGFGFGDWQSAIANTGLYDVSHAGKLVKEKAAVKDKNK